MMHRSSTGPIIAAALLALGSSAACAENRCVDANGRVTITDQVCPGGTTAKEVDSRLLSAQSVDAAVLRYTGAWLRGDADALSRAAVRTDVAFLQLRHRLTDPQHRDAALRALPYSAPQKVKVVRREFEPSGERVTAYCTAQVSDLLTDAALPLKGVVRLVRVGVEWKVESDDWRADAW